MNQNPSWEANSNSASQELPHIMEAEISLPWSQGPASKAL
jgi:hypothetical protein